MRVQLRLRARITIVVAVGALLVALGVALLLGNTLRLRNSSDATVRSDAYLLRVITVERLVVDSETGLRGFVITGRSLFLQPLYSARAGLPGATSALQSAARDEHAFGPQVSGLTASARAYLAGYVPRLLAMARQDQAAARTLAATLAGKREVDAIRARAAALERLVSARQLARQRAAQRSSDRAITEGVVVLVLLTLLTAALGGYLGHLVVERDRARQRSQVTAETLQQSILPAAIPDIPGCELAIRFEPAGAGELVGGDFYDVFEMAAGGWAIVLGDVCGKGAPAAAVTAMARWTLRSSAMSASSPAEALQSLNEVMARQPLDGRFITIAYMCLTVTGEHAHVDVACAGHPAPILLHPGSEPTVVRAEGDLLGVFPEIRIESQRVELHPGDSIIAFTDGVTDQGPETRRAPEVVLRDRPPAADAEQLADILNDLAHESPGPHRDDIAILAVRFRGAAGPEEPSAVELAEDPVPA